MTNPTADPALAEASALAGNRPRSHTDRAEELQAIERFMAERGVTRCEPACELFNLDSVLRRDQPKNNIMKQWPTRRYVRKR